MHFVDGHELQQAGHLTLLDLFLPSLTRWVGAAQRQELTGDPSDADSYEVPRFRCHGLLNFPFAVCQSENFLNTTKCIYMIFIPNRKLTFTIGLMQ